MEQGSQDAKPPQKGAIEPDVYIRALNGLATPKEEDQVRGYLAANFPRHGRLQRQAAQRKAKEQRIADFLQGLPEFQGTSEARIREVAGQLHQLAENRSQGGSPTR